MEHTTKYFCAPLISTHAHTRSKYGRAFSLLAFVATQSFKIFNKLRKYTFGVKHVNIYFNFLREREIFKENQYFGLRKNETSCI